MKRRHVVKESDETEVIILKHKDGGPLHRLLLKACPPNEDNEKSITILAGKFKPPLSTWAIHKWIKKGKIPPLRAAQVVDISEGRVSLAEFSPFIYV